MLICSHTVRLWSFKVDKSNIDSYNGYILMFILTRTKVIKIVSHSKTI